MAGIRIPFLRCKTPAETMAEEIAAFRLHRHTGRIPATARHGNPALAKLTVPDGASSAVADREKRPAPHPESFRNTGWHGNNRLVAMSDCWMNVTFRNRTCICLGNSMDCRAALLGSSADRLARIPLLRS